MDNFNDLRKHLRDPEQWDIDAAWRRLQTKMGARRPNGRLGWSQR